MHTHARTHTHTHTHTHGLANFHFSTFFVFVLFYFDREIYKKKGAYSMALWRGRKGAREPERQREEFFVTAVCFLTLTCPNAGVLQNDSVVDESNIDIWTTGARSLLSQQVKNTNRQVGVLTVFNVLTQMRQCWQTHERNTKHEQSM